MPDLVFRNAEHQQLSVSSVLVNSCKSNNQIDKCPNPK